MEKKNRPVAIVAAVAIAATGLSVFSIRRAVIESNKRLDEARAQIDREEMKILERRARAGEEAGLHGEGGADARSAAEHYAKYMEDAGVAQWAAARVAGAYVAYAKQTGKRVSREKLVDLGRLTEMGKVDPHKGTLADPEHWKAITKGDQKVR